MSVLEAIFGRLLTLIDLFGSTVCTYESTQIIGVEFKSFPSRCSMTTALAGGNLTLTTNGQMIVVALKMGLQSHRLIGGSARIGGDSGKFGRHPMKKVQQLTGTQPRF
eukprot:Trichotokara_eunicae@DN3541_c0_g1_i2.p2